MLLRHNVLTEPILLSIFENSAYNRLCGALHRRFMGTLKRECFDHFIFLSEDHLRRTASSFIAHYNDERVHQGIDGIPALGPGVVLARDPPSESSRLVAKPILGGLHHDYRLAA